MWEIVLIAVALAMDCFAVSVACGVLLRKPAPLLMGKMAFLFGFFQALMPLAGWLLTSRFRDVLQAVDHWVAFAMLAFIGGRMIYGAFREEAESVMDPRILKTRLLLAVATSIDALAVGISFACTGYDSLGKLWLPLLIIGLASFLFSIAGSWLGIRFGEVVNRRIKPELLGGIILLGIGIKILAEHLGGM
ncbi:MAG: manganese efflux pump [Bacteroidales bacterium]|nr:manganese efflux pump [Bacteroidales bacterium]